MSKVNWKRKSLKQVAEAARDMNRNACYELAVRLLMGLGVQPNPRAAYQCAAQAAACGQTQAMLLAGWCLVHAVGTMEDGEAACELFLRAARRGDAVACHNMGCCYLVGIGRPRSREAAKIWFALAAKRGYSRSSQALAALGVHANEAA